VIYFVANRSYALCIADKMLAINTSWPTPAIRHNGGRLHAVMPG